MNDTCAIPCPSVPQPCLSLDALFRDGGPPQRPVTPPPSSPHHISNKGLLRSYHHLHGMTVLKVGGCRVGRWNTPGMRRVEQANKKTRPLKALLPWAPLPLGAHIWPWSPGGVFLLTPAVTVTVTVTCASPAAPRTAIGERSAMICNRVQLVKGVRRQARGKKRNKNQKLPKRSGC